MGRPKGIKNKTTYRDEEVDKIIETDSVDAQAAEIIKNAEQKLDQKQIIGSEINELIDRKNDLNEKLAEISNDYNVKFRALQFMQTDIETSQRNLQNANAELQKKYSSEYAELKKKIGDFDSYMLELDTDKKHFKEDRAKLDLEILNFDHFKQEVEDKKNIVLSDVENRENEINIREATIDSKMKKLEIIKKESDASLKKLNDKATEINKEKSDLDSTIEELNSKEKELKHQKESLELERIKMVSDLTAKEKITSNLKSDYEIMIEDIKKKNEEYENKKLELSILSQRVDKQIKKYQLQEELKSGS